MKKSLIYTFLGLIFGFFGWLIYSKNKKVTAPSTTALKAPSTATEEELKASLKLIQDYEANLKNAPTNTEKDKLIAQQEAYINQLRNLVATAPGPVYTPPSYTAPGPVYTPYIDTRRI